MPLAQVSRAFEPPALCLGSAQMDCVERDAAGAGRQTGFVRRLKWTLTRSSSGGFLGGSRAVSPSRELS